jgi:hypothetical protein
VNSTPLFLAPKLACAPSEPGPPRRFSIRFPVTPLRPHLSGRTRPFFFGYDATVADACAVVADVGRLPFPPHAAFLAGQRLADEEFLFDIGATEIEIALVPVGGRTLRIYPGNGRPDILLELDEEAIVADIKMRLTDDFDVPGEIDLVAAGKVHRDEERLADAGFDADAYVRVFEKLPIGWQKGEPVASFEFTIRATRGTYSIPFSEDLTVAQAKSVIGGKLFRPMSELSIIDQVRGICLEDDHPIADYASPGRPFLVLIVDLEVPLTPEKRKLIAKWMPGQDEETVGKELFIRCGGNLTIFPRTCRLRGFV